MEDYRIEAPSGSQEVILTQHIYAPRHEVFKALTDPLLIPKYWGPERLTTEVYELNVMPGGTWRFVQTDKEGKLYAFHGVYHEVIIPKRLVYTSEYEGMPEHITFYTQELKEQDGRTIITTQVLFQSLADRDQLLQWGMEEGISEMTRRLNALLGKGKFLEKNIPMIEQFENSGECFTITRTFDAPREKVWERWTDPNQYMCWWGPKNFTSPYAMIDLRPGGKYLSCMRGPDGKKYWDTGEYEEIDKLNRIIYTDHFSDADGKIVPPSYYGMKGDQPIEMAVQVRLEDTGGKTRMVLEHCGYPDHETLDQAMEGWNQSFDKLAECLS